MILRLWWREETKTDPNRWMCRTQWAATAEVPKDMRERKFIKKQSSVLGVDWSSVATIHYANRTTLAFFIINDSHSEKLATLHRRGNNRTLKLDCCYGNYVGETILGRVSRRSVCVHVRARVCVCHGSCVGNQQVFWQRGPKWNAILDFGSRDIRE